MLNKKIVLITGAAGGLGDALVQKFCASSCRVVAASRNLPGAQHGVLVDEHETLSRAALDVTHSGQIESLVQAILQRFGRIDVLVNNAGRAVPAPLESISKADARTTMDVNFWGAIDLIHAVLPGMRAQRSGYIVNISSLSAHIGLPLDGVYSASKAALERASESLSLELLPFNVHVSNAIPGGIQTPLSDKMRNAISIDPASPYATLCERILQDFDNDDVGADPRLIAAEVVTLVSERDPPFNVAVGDQARAVLKTLKALSDNERREMQNQFSVADWWASQSID